MGSPRSLRLAITVALLCAGATVTASAQQTLIAGKAYTLDYAVVCATEEAARQLISIRTAGEFAKLPANCKFLRNIPFIFDAKLPLKGPSKLLHLHAGGKELCLDNVRREEVPCDVKIVPFTFFTGQRLAEGNSVVRSYVYLNDKITIAGN